MDIDHSFDYWRKLLPVEFEEGVTFYFTSPVDPNYNCLSWALSSNTVFFDDAPGCVWPWKDIPADTPDGWAEFCQRHGFSLVEDNNTEFVSGIEKIAILENQDGELHATRLDRSGLWKSKMGGWGPDIDHVDLLTLRGCYGKVVRVLQKERPDWRVEHT